MRIQIRNHEPGDEVHQARIFNAAAGPLPAFKPATADEVARRFRGSESDPSTRFFAVDSSNNAVVGYAHFHANGRVSFPWCLPGFEVARRPLLDALLAAMTGRGIAEAWAAYRADWSEVLAFFRDQDFQPAREVINFVAETDRLPTTTVPTGLSLGPLRRDDLPRLLELGDGLFVDGDLGAFFWENPWFGPESLFAIRDERRGVVGAGLAIISAPFADPVKLDAAMPCFRLGALGTERERHKRVNGLVSSVFDDDKIGEALLAEAARRLKAAGLAHAAAQVSNDRPDLVEFHDRFFRRQGAFPILARRLIDLS